MHKVALIGLGRVGSLDDRGVLAPEPRSHVCAVLQTPGCLLVAVCDPDPGQRAAFVDLWGTDVAVYSSVDELLAADSYDIIAVATPTPTHHAILKTVIASAPRVVICEKPFCSNSRQAEEITEMARAAGIPLVVNYFRRWDSKIRQLAQEFEGLGRPLRVEAVYGKGTRNYGSHLVNLLSFFFGPIHHVQSESLEIEQRNLPDPSISAVLQLETGLRASIIGIDHAGYDLLEIDVYYADRKITLQAGGISVATTMATGGIYFPGYAHLDFSNPTIEHSKVHGLLAAYQEIGQALETGSHPVTNTGESALETSRVLDAIIASAESGKRISL